MDDLQSEKEQIEEMRAWWSEYGSYVIAGIVIAVGGLIGFNQYTNSKLAAQTEASELYESLAVHVTDGDLDAAKSIADSLANDYADTSYAAQSKFAMAKLYMDKNRDQDAAATLKELLVSDGNDELKNIGRLRLARILLYQDHAAEAVDMLKAVATPSFAALSSELLGDAHAALGQTDAAAEAYRTALADPSQNPGIDRALVQMKLNDLAATKSPTEAEDTADDGTEDSAADTVEAAAGAENGGEDVE